MCTKYKLVHLKLYIFHKNELFLKIALFCKITVILQTQTLNPAAAGSNVTNRLQKVTSLLHKDGSFVIISLTIKIIAAEVEAVPINLVAAAVSLVLGVCSSEKFGIDFLMLCLVFYLLMRIIHMLISRVCNISPLVCAAMFVLGALLCRISTDVGLRDCSRYINRYVTVTGRICQTPTADGDNMRYVINAVHLRHGGEERDIDERILVTSDAVFEYNDTVEFTGFIKPFPERLNENGFDLIRYYKSKDIFFKMYSGKTAISDVQIRDYSIYNLAEGAKNSISQFIDKYNRGDKAAVLKAVLTGNKKELSEDFYKVLIRTATSRCLYPAYLHVMLITMIIGFTAGFLKKKYRDVILIALLLLYAVINSSRPVCLRVAVFSAAALIFQRKYGYADFKEMLSLMMIALGIFNPLILFDGGFITSVCAVILVRCFFGYVYGKLKFIRLRYIRGGLTVGLICSIGLLPLSAYFFGGISIYSAITTVLFIPPVAGIICSFPVVFAMTSVFGCAPIVSGFMTAMTYIIMYVPRLMDKLATSYIILPRPTTVFIMAYGAAVVAAGYYVHKSNTRAKWAALISAALFCSFTISQAARVNTAEITFVNVGQGDGAIVDVPYRGAILIDGGGGTEYSDYNVGEKVFLPYLETAGITRIEAAFVSHYHKDHAEGIISAIENLRVKNVFMPDVMPDSPIRLEIESAAEKHNTKIHYISEDSRVVFENGLTVEITVPAAKTKLISEDENDTSLLYNVKYGEFNCVFTGDMTRFAEQNLIDLGKAPECDVLKIAHHGSDTSTSENWIDALNPKCAVISVGADNGYGLPSNEVLDRLDGREVLRTDENGDIKIIGDKKGIREINSFRNSY